MKYRLPGIGGSSLFWLGSSIGLDSSFELLSRAEGHHAPRGDGDLLTRLRISTRALALVTEVEVAEPGQLNLLVAFKRCPNLLEEQLDDLLGFTLVETELLEQAIGHLRFGQGAHLIAPSLIRGTRC